MRVVQRPFDYITFDCYGTLIDWENGIGEAFRVATAEDGVTLDGDAVLRAYAEVERIVEQEMYRSYRDVLDETAARVAHYLGWPIERQHAIFLAESLPSWRPFADTNGALERLQKAGYQLGILSNVDDDLLSLTRRHFTVDFRLVITAQQVRSYKPAPGHFNTARERIAGAPWLHAAQSNFHDIIPTNALGISNAWINRRRELPLPGGVPGREFADMKGLADWLAA
jgi:2-haloacid dehalogenase/putative hydrolase of the HAD superfamily